MTDNSDLSPRVVQLARIIDRLPAGQFDIRLIKPEDKTTGWRVQVVQPVTIREATLTKQVPPPTENSNGGITGA